MSKKMWRWLTVVDVTYVAVSLYVSFDAVKHSDYICNNGAIFRSYLNILNVSWTKVQLYLNINPYINAFFTKQGTIWSLTAGSNDLNELMVESLTLLSTLKVHLSH